MQIIYSEPVSEMENLCFFTDFNFGIRCKLFGRSATFAIEATSKVRNHAVKLDIFHIITGFSIAKIFSKRDCKLS